MELGGSATRALDRERNLAELQRDRRAPGGRLNCPEARLGSRDDGAQRIEIAREKRHRRRLGPHGAGEVVGVRDRALSRDSLSYFAPPAFFGSPTLPSPERTLDLPDRQTLRLHLDCYMVWLEVTER
jgi:hypothetical protein